MKRGLKLGGGGVIVGDKIEELGGNPSVYQLDYREIVLHPASIGRPWCRGWVDVVAKTAKTKMDMEEMAPMVIVVDSEIKRDWNNWGDVDDCICEGKFEVLGEFVAE
jgi:hypothetical protein